jgi:hypothetical protein
MARASASISPPPAAAANPIAAGAPAALRWLHRHDPNFAALRRAARAAILMPALFALADRVIGSPLTATFAAFGSFSMLLLADFSGTMRARLQSQASLVLAACALIGLGTAVSTSTPLAAVAMALVGFGVLFSGVISSVLAGAATPLLLSFIISVSLPGGVSTIPERLAGWGLAGAASLFAIALMWPAPVREPLRSAASAACRAVAQRLRAEVQLVLGGGTPELAAGHELAIAAAERALERLRDTFFATPYRPTGLSTAARAVVRLVDEFNWLNAIVVQAAPRAHGVQISAGACAVKRAAADALEASALALEAPHEAPQRLCDAIDALEQALQRLERDTSEHLPVPARPAGGDGDGSEGKQGAWPSEKIVSALDPSFRAQELSFVTARIARNAEYAAAADRRSWVGQLLGREPAALGGRLASVAQRAGAHVERHSLWLHNSLRGGAALGLAVLVAKLTGVQHAFWVVFGTLSVLRSSALSTGQNILRSLLGTTIGFVLGAALVEAIGTNTDVLWVLLPFVVLFAGLAPATISFAAGQAAFTLVLLILFNILAPAGWRIGLVRIEDVALGGAVSLAVGLSFWPRGAGAAFSDALATAYRQGVAYLAAAVQFGLGRCDAETAERPVPTSEAGEAAAAARRLDDSFRGYLAERGSKPVPLAEMTTLVTGVAALRLAGDAVLDLWQHGEVPSGDRAAARSQLMHTNELLSGWYERFAASLVGAERVPEPLPYDGPAASRLAATVGRDLRGEDGRSTATAVRVIWTGDHLDAARRLQLPLVGSARTALERHALVPHAGTVLASAEVGS